MVGSHEKGKDGHTPRGRTSPWPPALVANVLGALRRMRKLVGRRPSKHRGCRGYRHSQRRNPRLRAVLSADIPRLTMKVEIKLVAAPARFNLVLERHPGHVGGGSLQATGRVFFGGTGVMTAGLFAQHGRRP